MRLLSRSESVGGKCPECKTIWTQYWELGEGLWACRRCGCVFVPKAVRDEGDRRHREEAERARLDVSAGNVSSVAEKSVVGDPGEPAGHICAVCGKSCKTALALMGHMRSHG